MHTSLFLFGNFSLLEKGGIVLGLILLVLIFYKPTKTPAPTAKPKDPHPPQPPAGTPPAATTSPAEPKKDAHAEKPHDDTEKVKKYIGIALCIGLGLLIAMPPQKEVQTQVYLHDEQEYVVPVSKQYMNIEVSAPCRVFAGTSADDGTWYKQTPTKDIKLPGSVKYIKYKAYPNTDCTITYSK